MFLSYLLVVLSRRKRSRNFEIQKLREKNVRNKIPRRHEEFSIAHEVFFECFYSKILFFYLSSTSNISLILTPFSFVLISIFFLRWLRNTCHNFLGIFMLFFVFLSCYLFWGHRRIFFLGSKKILFINLVHFCVCCIDSIHVYNNVLLIIIIIQLNY